MSTALPCTLAGTAGIPVARDDDRAFFGHPRGLVHALLHRDVGALQLLRDARAAHPVHDRAAGGGRSRLRRGDRRRDVRLVHVDGVHDEPAGRLDRGPADRPAARRALSAASSSRAAISAWRFPSLHDVLSRPGADRRRHRPAERQHQRDRRPAVRADDQRRDAGFSIFYMGINIGAFVGAARLRLPRSACRTGTSGFAAAGVGMALGSSSTCWAEVIWARPDSSRRRRNLRKTPRILRRRAKLWGGLAAGLVVLVGLGMATGALPVTPTQVADLAGYLLLVTDGHFFRLAASSPATGPAPSANVCIVIGVFFLAAALFWSSFEQAGSTLNLFADRDTQTSLFGWEFPSSWFQSVNAIFIIGFAPLFAWLWLRLGPREPSSPAKFSLGLILVGMGFVVLMLAAAESAPRRQGRARTGYC